MNSDHTNNLPLLGDVIITTSAPVDADMFKKFKQEKFVDILREEIEKAHARMIDDMAINGGNVAGHRGPSMQPSDQPIRMNLPSTHLFTFVPDNFAKLGPPQENCVWICFVTGMHLESTSSGMQIKLESTIMQVPKDSLREAVEYQVKELHLERLFGVDKPDAKTIADRNMGETMRMAFADEPVPATVTFLPAPPPYQEFMIRMGLPEPTIAPGQFLVFNKKIEP